MQGSRACLSYDNSKLTHDLWVKLNGTFFVVTVLSVLIMIFMGIMGLAMLLLLAVIVFIHITLRFGMGIMRIVLLMCFSMICLFLVVMIIVCLSLGDCRQAQCKNAYNKKFECIRCRFH